MRTLSKQAEDQIISGVKRAVSMVDDGMTPSAAIEKISRELKWGPELVKFASYAYNTGRQNAQLENSKSALDKFADFEMADPLSVIASIWPQQVKAASDIELPVSGEYSHRPHFNSDRDNASRLSELRRDSKAAMEKAAAEKMCKACGKEPCCCKMAGFEEIRDKHRKLKTAAESARTAASLAYDQLISDVSDLGQYFRKAAMDRCAFADADLAASVYYGTPGRKLMDCVYQRNNMKEARADDKHVKFAGDVFDVKIAPYGLIDRCIKQAAIVTDKRAAEFLAVETVNNYVHTDLMPVAGAAIKTASWDMLDGDQTHTRYDETNINLYLIPAAVTPFSKTAAAEPPAPPEPWSLLMSEKAADGLMEMVMPAAIGSTTKQLLENAMVSKVNPNDPVADAQMELEDPAHDAELRKIRTQAMMTDLMNDDVIGGYSPDEVSKTYNELSQLAPRAGQQPSIMRAALRRHLQGAVTPFENDQILSTEKGLKDTSLDTPAAKEMRSAPAKLVGA